MSYSYTFNPFTFSFAKSGEALDWLAETRRTARRIAERTTKPIYLCMSGGIDSEVAAEAFLAEKIPFTALTLSYKGINDHDIVI